MSQFIKKLLLLRSFVNKHFRPSTFLRKLDILCSQRHLFIYCLIINKFNVSNSIHWAHSKSALITCQGFAIKIIILILSKITFCPKNRPLYSPNRARGSADPSDPPLDPLLSCSSCVTVMRSAILIYNTRRESTIRAKMTNYLDPRTSYYNQVYYYFSPKGTCRMKRFMMFADMGNALVCKGYFTP